MEIAAGAGQLAANPVIFRGRKSRLLFKLAKEALRFRHLMESRQISSHLGNGFILFVQVTQVIEELSVVALCIGNIAAGIVGSHPFTCMREPAFRIFQPAQRCIDDRQPIRKGSTAVWTQRLPQVPEALYFVEGSLWFRLNDESICASE